jgi:hypothetical protein
MAILSSPLQYLASVPPVTRAWTAATVVSTLFYFWVAWKTHNDYAPYITLVPGSSVFYPWTFLTSALVETSVVEVCITDPSFPLKLTILQLLVTLIVIPASLRYLERLWGTIETIKFMVASIVVSNIIAFGFNWIEYVVTKNADLFLYVLSPSCCVLKFYFDLDFSYGMQYHGQMSLLIAVLVAFTQVIPEHQVQIMGIFKTRVKVCLHHFCACAVILNGSYSNCP